MNGGYFKKGEIVEVSGNIYGLVTSANEITADIQKIVTTSTGNFLTTKKQVVRNSLDQYENVYWIKTLKRQDISLECLGIKPLTML